MIGRDWGDQVSVLDGLHGEGEARRFLPRLQKYSLPGQRRHPQESHNPPQDRQRPPHADQSGPVPPGATRAVVTEISRPCSESERLHSNDVLQDHRGRGESNQVGDHQERREDRSYASSRPHGKTCRGRQTRSRLQRLPVGKHPERETLRECGANLDRRGDTGRSPQLLTVPGFAGTLWYQGNLSGVQH